MKKYIFFLFLSWQVFAQYPILNDSIKKAGIYKTFDEFKNNNPSIPLKHKIIAKNNIFFTNWGKETITTYSVDMPKDESRDLGNVYGFCDGFNFYVINFTQDFLSIEKNAPIFRTVHRSIFYRISAMGKYPYLDVADGRNMDMNDGNGGFDLSQAPSVDLTVINLETGIMKKLTVKIMKEILADKPDLLEKFKNQESKNDYLKVYLKEYLKN